jgi:hypothetical protein
VYWALEYWSALLSALLYQKVSTLCTLHLMVRPIFLLLFIIIKFKTKIYFIKNIKEFHNQLKASTTANARSESDPHSVIGITLVIGFIIMLLIDQLANRHYTNNTYNIALSSGLSFDPIFQ